MTSGWQLIDRRKKSNPCYINIISSNQWLLDMSVSTGWTGVVECLSILSGGSHFYKLKRIAMFVPT